MRIGNYGFIETDIGIIRVTAGPGGVSGVHFMDEMLDPDVMKKDGTEEINLSECLRQLQEYFGGERTEFDLKLQPEGTAFQREVWNELLKIPYAGTVSYGYIAEKLGRPGAARAVGRANSVNPIAVIIPCHRVIGADGSLTGYAAGLDRKRYLLQMEKERTI
ncbi:MAG: methylated-DNA--[protein]-cysteine S-methyltransferase [Candidatus Krumholzibacteriales bacterium]